MLESIRVPRRPSQDAHLRFFRFLMADRREIGYCFANKRAPKGSDLRTNAGRSRRIDSGPCASQRSLYSHFPLGPRRETHRAGPQPSILGKISRFGRLAIPFSRFGILWTRHSLALIFVAGHRLVCRNVLAAGADGVVVVAVHPTAHLCKRSRPD